MHTPTTDKLGLQIQPVWLWSHWTEPLPTRLFKQEGRAGEPGGKGGKEVDEGEEDQTAADYRGSQPEATVAVPEEELRNHYLKT